MKRFSFIKTKGINVFFLHSAFAVIAFVVFAGILLLSSYVIKRYMMVQEAISRFMACQQSSREIMEYSNYLTEQARLFVTSQKPKYFETYLKEASNLQTQRSALERIRKISSGNDIALQRLEMTLMHADSLIDMELYAIRLGIESINRNPSAKGNVDMPERLQRVRLREIDNELSYEELRELSISTLFNEGYLIYRDRINENCNNIVQTISENISGNLQLNADQLGNTLRKLRLCLFLLMALAVLSFASLVVLVLKPLKKFQNAINKEEKLGIMGSEEFRNIAYSYNEIYDMKTVGEKMLLFNAEYDSLTGIFNRRAFDHFCKTTAEKSQRIALLLINLDNFKRLNDTYGTSCGDVVLKELSRQLAKTFRNSDYIARIGGDEFAAILVDFNPAYAKVISSKIEEINDDLLTFNSEIKNATISVGAAFSDVGFNQELYKNADSALYAVKTSGRKGCRIFYNS